MALTIALLIGIGSIEAQEDFLESLQQDLERQEELEKKAQDGDTDAMFRLGLTYAKVKGIEDDYLTYEVKYPDDWKPDYKKACDWWQKAAEEGHTDAMLLLSQIYSLDRGNNQTSTMARAHIGIEKDLTKAREWIEKAAEDREHMGAVFSLGMTYATGIAGMLFRGHAETDGPEKNTKKADELFALYAEKGEESMVFGTWINSRTRANSNDLEEVTVSFGIRPYSVVMSLLGNLYAEGFHVKQDVERAKAYFALSAEKGGPGTLLRLAKMYSDDDTVEKDLTKARELFIQSAEKGVSQTMAHLAEIYAEGELLEEDLTKAHEWLTKISEIRNNIYINYVYYAKGVLEKLEAEEAKERTLKMKEDIF